MSNLVLHTLCKEVKEIYKKKEYKWNDDIITNKDIEILKKESSEESPFDKLHLKKNIYDNFVKGNKTVQSIVKKTKNFRIVILSENIHEFYPWKTWARIFQWFGMSHATIYIYSSKQQRILPNEDIAIGPEYVNGGYTYPCKSDCVVIYRYEEITRVLIHELLHAACTDDFSKPVEQREALTETWAELFLVALLSKGDIFLANKLWLQQDHHIQDLNNTLLNFYKNHEYASRYTIMRTPVLDNLGIQLDTNYTSKHIKSSRFTSVELDNYLE